MTEREIFFHAIELPEPGDRFAFLEKACADSGLRRRVESLLRSHSTAGRFLATPAVGSAGSALDAVQSFLPTPNPHADPTRADGGDPAVPDGSLAFADPPRRSGSLGRLGHYELLEVLGRGGFGIVYRAIDDLLERVVAVKVFAPTAGIDSPAHLRFLREARASALVRHENVVSVFDVVERPVPYLVMEYVRGGTLQDRLDRGGPASVAETLAIGRQIAEGLAAAHARGLIHRDIKPSNILLEVGPDGRVKITDFGLARTVGDLGLTQSGVLAGTPLYMAPEIALGGEFDSRADLFSLGSVLYAMAGGQPPFQASNAYSVLKSVVESDPKPIRDLNPDVPVRLGEIIARLHAKDPDGRFATARDVADLLGHCQSEWERTGALAGGRAVVAKAEPPRRVRSRARTASAIAAMLAVVLGGLGASEAFGLSNVRGTILRILSPEGTLVVEVDDPGVSVTVDGSELAIAGAGVKEVRLKTGPHAVEARKAGQVVKRELITIEKDGRKIVRVSLEPTKPDAAATAAWEKSVAALPAVEQVKAVAARLRLLNPGFDGQVDSSIVDGVVRGLDFQTDRITDISPVRVLTGLKTLKCYGSDRYNTQLIQNLNGKLQVRSVGSSKLSDLSPLKGLSLTELRCFNSNVADLAPLAGMKLTSLHITCTLVSDLAPLKGMPLTDLSMAYTKVVDLAPLAGMALHFLSCDGTDTSDLTPLKGMPLRQLGIGRFVTDLTPLKGMPLVEFTAYRSERLTDLAPLKGLPLKLVNVQNSKVSSLEPLSGIALEYLIVCDTPVSDLTPTRKMNSLKSLCFARTKVTDLSPVKGLSLVEIETNEFSAGRDAPILRAISTLKVIDKKPAAEFWKSLE